MSLTVQIDESSVIPSERAAVKAGAEDAFAGVDGKWAVDAWWDAQAQAYALRVKRDGVTLPVPPGLPANLPQEIIENVPGGTREAVRQYLQAFLVEQGRTKASKS